MMMMMQSMVESEGDGVCPATLSFSHAQSYQFKKKSNKERKTKGKEGGAELRRLALSSEVLLLSFCSLSHGPKIKCLCVVIYWPLSVHNFWTTRYPT